MSYTGFFAETDLYEVAKDGDSVEGLLGGAGRARRGHRAGRLRHAPTDPITGEPRPVLHRRGTFVFRLAGRERQQSRVLLHPRGADPVRRRPRRSRSCSTRTVTRRRPRRSSSSPSASRRSAPGRSPSRRSDSSPTSTSSAARRSSTERIDPDDYPRELQKVKAYLALHQVYGVDLNATAVELAEISLWLDTMVEGLARPVVRSAPAPRQLPDRCPAALFTARPDHDKSWLKAVPTPVRSGFSGGERVHRQADRRPDPALPRPRRRLGRRGRRRQGHQGPGPDAVKDLKDWRRSIRPSRRKKQVDALVVMGERVETLWEI